MKMKNKKRKYLESIILDSDTLEVFQNFHKSCRPCIFVSILHIISVSTTVAIGGHVVK